MKSKKWISELQRGELFTILPDVIDASHFFIALGTTETISQNGSRPCRVFNDFSIVYYFANVQVFSCGLIVTPINSPDYD